jgi:hypothetical protein
VLIAHLLERHTKKIKGYNNKQTTKRKPTNLLSRTTKLFDVPSEENDGLEEVVISMPPCALPPPRCEFSLCIFPSKTVPNHYFFMRTRHAARDFRTLLVAISTVTTFPHFPVSVVTQLKNRFCTPSIQEQRKTKTKSQPRSNLNQ